MSGGIFLPPSSSLPDDSIPDVPCPVKSSAALAMVDGAPTKVILDVPCRRKCPWFMEREDGSPTCAVAVLARAVAERS